MQTSWKDKGLEQTSIELDWIERTSGAWGHLIGCYRSEDCLSDVQCLKTSVATKPKYILRAVKQSLDQSHGPHLTLLSHTLEHTPYNGKRLLPVSCVSLFMGRYPNDLSGMFIWEAMSFLSNQALYINSKTLNNKPHNSSTTGIKGLPTALKHHLFSNYWLHTQHSSTNLYPQDCTRSNIAPLSR